MSAGLKGVADVAGYVAKSIDNVEGLESRWENAEVVEVLKDIREGLAAEPAPTWAEVTISEVLAERDAFRAERDELRAELRSLEGNTAAATVLWEAVERERRGERDRARATAVRLEQELAAAERSRDSYLALAAVLADPAWDGGTEQIRIDVATVRAHLQRGTQPQLDKRYWGGLEWALARLLGMKDLA